MRYAPLILTMGIMGSSTWAAPEKLPDLVYRSNAVYSVLEAAAWADAGTMQRRIQEGCNVNQRDEQGNTALHLAAARNAKDCIRLLLQSGADPLVQNAAGGQAVQLAGGEASRQLLQDAMDIRSRECEICDKVAAGDMEALRAAMQQKGFNPNILNRQNDQSLLVLVCRHGTPQMVNALIQAGADVNYISPSRHSVLHHAIYADNAEIIRILLENGANPMVKAGNSAYALHDAVWHHRTNSIRALLPAYKSVNFSPYGDHNGTPIGLAIGRGFPDVVQLFIDAGIDLNDPSARMPLIQAAREGRRRIVEMMLKAGADKSLRNREGQTARDVAAESVRNLL